MTKTKTFSNEERAAMKERAEELHASKKNGEGMLLEKVVKMPEPDRTMAKKDSRYYEKACAYA